MIRTENSGMNFCRRICLHNCCCLSGSACLGIVFGYGQILLNNINLPWLAHKLSHYTCISFTRYSYFLSRRSLASRWNALPIESVATRTQ
jgi:hypothetical protein